MTSVINMEAMSMIAQSINNAVGGSGTTVNYGGMGSADNGGIAARVKEQFTENFWEEDFNDE
jgi:hypothetical protein